MGCSSRYNRRFNIRRGLFAKPNSSRSHTRRTDVTVPPRQVVYYALSSTEAKGNVTGSAEGSVLGVVALNRQFPTTDYTVLTTDKEVIAKAGCTAITLYPTTSYPSSKLDGIKISNQSGLTISVAPNGADLETAQQE